MHTEDKLGKKAHMLVLISPSKTLDFDSTDLSRKCSSPLFNEEATQLVSKLRGFSKRKIRELMGVSEKLAELNQQRFLAWHNDASLAAARPAVLAYQGDVYQGLEADQFSEEDLDFAQDHLRILSGLYGLLRPLDMIEPYRLEMGVPLKVGRKKDLYAFWGEKLTRRVNGDVESSGSKAIINLASKEYWSAIDTRKLKVPVISPIFKDERNGEFKFITLFGKKARGWLTAHIIQNRITEPESLKQYSRDGYSFNPALSSETDWVFTR